MRRTFLLPSSDDAGSCPRRLAPPAQGSEHEVPLRVQDCDLRVRIVQYQRPRARLWLWGRARARSWRARLPVLRLTCEWL